MHHFEFEALLSFFWNGFNAVDTCKIGSLFRDLMGSQLIVEDVRREWISNKYKGLSIDVAVLIKLVNPLLMGG